MKKRGHKLSFEQKLSLCGYLLIPLFFIILYFLMTETYEDVFQTNMHKDSSVGEIVGYVNSFIPRIGEFYQRIAVHFMTFQVSFGLDMVFRLLNVAMATGVMYFCTMFKEIIIIPNIICFII